jgi:hypothetical protein
MALSSKELGEGECICSQSKMGLLRVKTLLFQKNSHYPGMIEYRFFQKYNYILAIHLVTPSRDS